MLHIGIVACSAEGAALCYKTICIEGESILGARAHPEVSLHSHSFGDYMRCIERKDWQGVGGLMLSSAQKLAKSGADLLICPDNTIHQSLPYIASKLPLPWLHIAEVVAQVAVQRGFKHIGLTGTRWLVDSNVYPDALQARGLSFARPSAAERDQVNGIIMNELVKGRFTAESSNCLVRVIEGLRQQGSDAVVLGCTEIPLIINDGNSPLPTLDSTRLLARAALKRAAQGQSTVQAGG
jgi:aspartate racemase